ncbi:glycosyltransferase family 9 protein [Sphingomonas sp. WG]|uniref:glycosyltransferase family 9 protein n=1 Tax=unclassified Sphingomonas TaxID=196159 RepID=UPI0009EACA0B
MTMEVVLSPFSNSFVRDWPAEHYRTLVGMLVDFLPGATVRLIGTKAQALRANEIVRPLDSRRVLNDCGRHPWPVVQTAILRASCVIGNNSGVAHLAASAGVPTVCIFGGSHQRREWRPVGPNVIIVSRDIWCSPCHLDRLSQCRFDKSCLRDIEPSDVLSAVQRVLSFKEPLVPR